MTPYFVAVKAQFKDWKVAILVVMLTLARVLYGYAWVEAGLRKLEWFSDGKLNSAGTIETMITNIAGPKVQSCDPFCINKTWAWVAQNIFLSMPELTDTLVIIFEISVGVLMILGFKIFWASLLAMFMNIQFFASGSFNNFGYIWTNLAVIKFAQYSELLGLDGFLRFKKGKNIIQTANKYKDVMAK